MVESKQINFFNKKFLKNIILFKKMKNIITKLFYLFIL